MGLSVRAARARPARRVLSGHCSPPLLPDKGQRSPLWAEVLSSLQGPAPASDAGREGWAWRLMMRESRTPGSAQLTALPLHL